MARATAAGSPADVPRSSPALRSRAARASPTHRSAYRPAAPVADSGSLSTISRPSMVSGWRVTCGQEGACSLGSRPTEPFPRFGSSASAATTSVSSDLSTPRRNEMAATWCRWRCSASPRSSGCRASLTTPSITSRSRATPTASRGRSWSISSARLARASRTGTSDGWSRGYKAMRCRAIEKSTRNRLRSGRSTARRLSAHVSFSADPALP